MNQKQKKKVFSNLRKSKRIKEIQERTVTKHLEFIQQKQKQKEWKLTEDREFFFNRGSGRSQQNISTNLLISIKVVEEPNKNINCSWHSRKKQLKQNIRQGVTTEKKQYLSL